MEVVKHCGYFGCHVRNSGECECTKCSMTTGGCQNCTRYPAKVRGDQYLSGAMALKCEVCRNLSEPNADRITYDELKRKVESGAYQKMGKPDAAFEDDCTAYVMWELNLDRKKAGAMMSKAYSDGHSAGYGEVLYYLDELCDLMREVLPRRM